MLTCLFGKQSERIVLKGMEKLGNFIDSKHEVSLLEINLKNNAVSDEGTKYLATHLKHCQADKIILNLENNFITDSGVNELIKGIKEIKPLKPLSVLLSGNSISESKLKELAQLVETINKLEAKANAQAFANRLRP